MHALNVWFPEKKRETFFCDQLIFQAAFRDEVTTGLDYHSLLWHQNISTIVLPFER